MPQLYSQFAVAIQEEARGIFGVIGVVGREDRFTVRRGFRKRERYMTSESSSSSPSSAPGLAFFYSCTPASLGHQQAQSPSQPISQYSPLTLYLLNLHIFVPYSKVIHKGRVFQKKKNSPFVDDLRIRNKYMQIHKGRVSWLSRSS
jgi:hypothetical protein